ALAGTSVHHGRVERLDVHAVEATNIDRHHLLAVGHFAACKRFHPAGGAEQVGDRFGVEAIFGEACLALFQLEILGWRKGEDTATLLAIRAIAGDRARKINFDLERNRAAVAASQILHRSLQFYPNTILAADSGSSSPNAR